MKDKRRGVLAKIIMLFSFTVLPITAIGAIGLWTVNLTSERALLQSVSDNVGIFSHSFDNQLRQTYDLAGNTLTMLVAKQLSNPRLSMSMYNRVVSINLLRDTLTNIKTSDSTLTNVRVYLPNQGIIYNSAGLPLGSQQEMTENDYTLLSDLRNSPHRLHYYDNRIFMLRYSQLNNPDIVSEIEFSRDRLDKILKSSFLSDESTYILMTQGYNLYGGTGDQELITAVFDLLANTADADIYKLRHQGVDYRIFRSGLSFLHSDYYQIIPAEYFFRPMQLSVEYTIVFVSILIICVAIFLFGAYHLIHNPLKTLVTAFNEIKNKNFTIRVANPKTSDFIYLYDSFNNMAEHLDELIKQDYELKMLLQRAELKQLQAQINPHFLYNSFFILNQMIYRKEHEESMKVSKMLGEYFQYITRSHNDVATLKDEYRHVQIYSDIQNMRFSGRIHVDIEELPKECNDIKVPKLILQPILENAFNYAMEDKIKDGLVRMRIVETDTGFNILTEDNGTELTDEKLEEINTSLKRISESFDSEEKTGLLNIHKRLELFFNKSGMLTVFRSPLGGLAVMVHLPVKECLNVSLIDS